MPQPNAVRARNWLPEHDQFIRDNWPTMKLSDIASILCRDIPTTSKRAKVLGLPSKVKRWTPAEDAVLRKHYRTKPIAWVAKLLNRTGPQCSTRAGVLGLRLGERGAAAHRG